MKTIESYSLVSEYKSILTYSDTSEYELIVRDFSSKLSVLWCKAYKNNSNRIADICVINHKTFNYIFDDNVPSESDGMEHRDSIQESRIVAVFGISNPQKVRRDDYRLKGWIGKTEKIFGKSWDKGHFIAHSIGGAVDGIEINVFQQKRSLNRGWSERGKVFRKMERYCFENKGVFCFNRPIYLDESCKPAMYEFGILKVDGSIWVEVFDNS